MVRRRKRAIFHKLLSVDLVQGEELNTNKDSSFKHFLFNGAISHQAIALNSEQCCELHDECTVSFQLNSIELSETCKVEK